jgi:hypothetical protein
MKTMRKSMFISTVLMVVLLIVALSTATFAWFSANNTVIATQTTMTAATSTDANITIGWTTNPQEMGSSISFDSASALHPTIPMLKPVKAGETGTIPAQYVSTNKELSEEDTYSFTYQSYNVPFLTVVDAKSAARGSTIPYDEDLLAEDYGLTGTITPLMRIYRTSWDISARYVATESQVPLNETVPISYNGKQVPFLNVVADGTATADNDIGVEEANTIYYDMLYALEDIGLEDEIEASIGDRIYHMKAVQESFALIDINGAAPANFISGGMDGSAGNPGIIDFLTIFDNEDGYPVFPVKVDSSYYIDYDDHDEFVDWSAVGDRIYCVRPANTNPTRTKLEDFVLPSNFSTANIDVNNRFRAAGGGAPGGDGDNLFVNLEEKGEGTGTTFYLMNNNAVGSQRAEVTMKVDINAESGTALGDLRIAVFVQAAGETELYYYGTLSKGDSASTYYGTIADGAFSTSYAFQKYKYFTDGDTLAQKISIDPQTYAAISIVVWFDGVSLGNAEAGQEVNFTFTFTA